MQHTVFKTQLYVHIHVYLLMKKIPRERKKAIIRTVFQQQFLLTFEFLQNAY
jgi:hypothetical protein